MVVFHEDSHEYYVDGVKVPSVTELVRKYSELHGLDDYTTVPSGSPRKAAPKGTTIQQEIERYEKDGAEGSSEEFRNYLELKGKCGIKAESSGLPVLIFDGSGKPVCAGRLDLCGTVMGGSAIIGIRRTAKIYKAKVSLQLNLYRLGYKESYGEPCESLYVLRLRRSASEFARIPVDENYAYALLRECLPSFSENPAPDAEKRQGRIPRHGQEQSRRQRQRQRLRNSPRLLIRRMLRRGRKALRRRLPAESERQSAREMRSASGMSAGSGGSSLPLLPTFCSLCCFQALSSAGKPRSIWCSPSRQPAS